MVVKLSIDCYRNAHRRVRTAVLPAVLVAAGKPSNMVQVCNCKRIVGLHLQMAAVYWQANAAQGRCGREQHWGLVAALLLLLMLLLLLLSAIGTKAAAKLCD